MRDPDAGSVLIGEWQLTNPEPATSENCHTSVCQFGFKHWESWEQHIQVVLSNEQIRVAEKYKRRTRSLLRGENRAEVGIGRNDNPILGVEHGPRSVRQLIHAFRTPERGLHPGPLPQATPLGRRRARALSMRNLTPNGGAAVPSPWHKQPRSVSTPECPRNRRSGYCVRISLSEMPPANSRSTVATGMRRCRIHGTPPI